MIELETKNVGRTLSRKFIHEVSATVSLPFDVCEALLQAGWTLEVHPTKPAMWVQAWPSELRMSND